MLDFIGRVHPLLVHFPVALLLVAALGWVVARGRPDHPLTPAVDRLLALAALGAVAAALSGLRLAAIEDFQGRSAVLLERHRLLGLGVAGLAVMAASARAFAKDRIAWHRGAVGLTLLAALGVSAAGYLGGELAHGEGHLLGDDEDEGGSVAEELAVPPGPGADGKVDFRRQVQPILRRSCHKCHSARKQEGELRLDDRELAMKGGEDGVVIKPGDAEGSELIRRITLPRDHEDYMPGKGKPLSEAQIQVLRDWIDQGAVWPD